MNDLAKMINRYALHSFACAVHVPAWQTVNAEYCLAERLLRPYPLCGRTIVKQVRDWCQATGHDPGAVRYVFDQDFDDWGMLIDRLKLDYAIAPIPADRRDVRPLQAADWLAYEGFRETPESEALLLSDRDRTRDPRASLLALLRLPADPKIYREGDLRRMCEDPNAKISKRLASN